jgi:hypothetical protein
MQRPNLDDVARRPAQYWTIDGLPELMLGVVWIIWGGAWLAGQRLPHEWPWKAYWLIVPPALAMSGLAANAITRALKRRLTFPRAGYVEWQRPERLTAYRVAAAIVVVAATLAVVTLGAGRSDFEQRAPAAITVILALSFVALSVRQRTPHHLALAAAAVALAVAVSVVTSGWDAMNWLFVALGSMCILVGGIRLARFLRTHPLPAVEGS